MTISVHASLPKLSSDVPQSTHSRSKIIPDTERPVEEQEPIKALKESVTNFEELPRITDKAMIVMGMDASSTGSRAFAKDILSIETEGPLGPQLTLVNLRGIVQNESKGISAADLKLVHEITDRYISQSRTICLAVVSATNDYQNQLILTKVRNVDKDGERTLGIITKPDRLPAASGTEGAFLDLAGNNDIFFKFGWHVLKNRSFEEGSCSFLERNASEDLYFAISNFKSLPKDCVGVHALRERLSNLLFEHVKQELPKLQEDLQEALDDTTRLFEALGSRRVSVQECRTYLTQLSLEFHMVCKAALDGHYEDAYFNPSAGTSKDGVPFSICWSRPTEPS
ncbi:hypothetical protein LTS18_012276 [Coniosporium uncinatum]|uniref:Uncharacterized protein n=1 Tax=Coniosporium uncinatum TaxID=93489 RepID=A0ACC3DBZ6_9PEZI|nr:hypothetical protein LTS18_012276 [Coniosporium uncinatum]